MPWATEYRPQKLSEVLGQAHIEKSMRQILDTNNLHPVYLVSGGWGSGKTTSLRIFAKALTCPNVQAGEGCGICDECKALEEVQHNSNYMEVDAADHGNIDDIRMLIDQSTLSVRGTARKRVVLMDEVHQLSKPAQNACLKLFEEGSQTTIYLLATTDPDKLLPTISSRAIRWKIRPIPKEAITGRLGMIASDHSVKTEEKALDLIYKQTRGHVRDAITLLEQVSVTGDVTETAVRAYLELDQDREIAHAIVTLKNRPLDSYDMFTQVMSKMAPENAWSAIKRVLNEALRCQVLGGQDHPLHDMMSQIIEAYDATLPKVNEYILSSRMSPGTVTEVLCAVACIHTKLIKDVKLTAVNTPKWGRPEREKDQVKKPLMPPETFMQKLEL